MKGPGIEKLVEDSESLVGTISDADKGSLREFVCGWGAAFINVVITFPINKLMFRQMLHGVGTHKALDELKVEGAAFLYRGILPPLIQKTFSVSLMFGVYDKCGHVIAQRFPHVSPNTNMVISAMCAGTFEAALTPLERIQTLLQDPKYNLRYRNTFHVTSHLRQHGLGEYFRGLVPILVRNGPSNIMFFGMRTEFQKLYPETDYLVGRIVADFVSGAFIGALISTVFYPINVIKARMQVQVGGSYTSIYSAFKTIYVERDRSVKRFFHGVHLNYTRALISWGIINASYELLKRILPDIKETSKS